MRIVDRVVSALSSVTSDIAISASGEESVEWLSDVAILTDKYAGFGGVAGIHAALLGDRDVLAVAWDMPFVPPDLLAAVVQTAADTGADAVVPESASPHGFEPFCAWYSARTRDAAERFLSAGGGGAHHFLSLLPNVHRIPLSVVAQFGDPAVLFLSVNTTADLERARAIASAAQ